MDAKKALEKLRIVLDYFRDNKEFALIWRPHPLNEPTAQSMLPHLLREDQEIIDKYRRENWGIFDDTGDFNLGMAISSAYYGDWSSLVCLYGMT